MSNTKTTKRALLTSIMALMLCFAMLTGTTFAWFTDTETSSNNRIVAGTLDVDLQMDKAEDGNYVSIAGGSGDIFKEGANANDSTATLWEPGKTQVVYLAVANLGNLALKYNIVLNVTDEDTTDAVNLGDVLEFAVVDYGKTAPATRIDAWDASAAVPTLGSLLVDGKVVAAPNGQLEVGESDYFALAVHMQEEAGNEYQGKSISIDVTVVATQLNAEEDSFGKDYDEDAVYPVASVPVSIPTEDVTDPITLNANGMEVEVPATVINNLPAEVTQISLTYSASAVEDDTITFASVKLVDQNGNEIELDGSNGAIEVTLPAQTTFAAGEIVYIYHDGEYVDMATVADDGTISYEAAHFCEVTISGEFTGEPTKITASTIITESGCYELANDIEGYIIVADGDVVIDLKGYNIEGSTKLSPEWLDAAQKYNLMYRSYIQTPINIIGGNVVINDSVGTSVISQTNTSNACVVYVGGGTLTINGGKYTQTGSCNTTPIQVYDFTAIEGAAEAGYDTCGKLVINDIDIEVNADRVAVFSNNTDSIVINADSYTSEICWKEDYAAYCLVAAANGVWSASDK